MMRPPLRIFTACLLIWLCVLFYVFVHFFTMAFIYSTGFAMVLILIILKYVVFEPVDPEIAKRVFYKDNLLDLPIYAHRGGGHDAPENTIAAIKEAKKNGADGVEFDLSFTKDNIAVLFHDETIDRTTDGSGKLSSKLYEEVQMLDASAKHLYKDKFKGERVPLFTEAMTECLKLGLRIIIDVKEYDSRAVVVIADMFAENKDLYEKALVASFFPNFLYQLRRVDPNIVTAQTYRPKFMSYQDIPNGRPRFESSWKMALARVGDFVHDWTFHNLLWYVIGVSGVLVHKDFISAEYARMWRSRDVHLIAWTANHKVDKDYLTSLNITYITDTMLS